MGFASYTEDIANRYLSHINDLKADIEGLRRAISEAVVSVGASNKLKAITRSCDQLDSKLNRLLEIATHPWVSAAERYFADQVRLQRIGDDFQEAERAHKQRVTELESIIKEREEEIVQWRTKTLLLKDANKELRKQTDALKEEISIARDPKKFKEMLPVEVTPLKKGAL
jgi:chromosome segregation ATPase